MDKSVELWKSMVRPEEKAEALLAFEAVLSGLSSMKTKKLRSKRKAASQHYQAMRSDFRQTCFPPFADDQTFRLPVGDEELVADDQDRDLLVGDEELGLDRWHLAVVVADDRNLLVGDEELEHHDQVG